MLVKHLLGVFMQKFSNRLKDLRLEKNLSQKQLGDKTGIGATTIQSYELNTRTPSITIAVVLARFFDVSLDYLCGLTDNRHSSNVVSPNEFVPNVQYLFRQLSEVEQDAVMNLLITLTQGKEKESPCPCGSGKKYKDCCWYK